MLMETIYKTTIEIAIISFHIPSLLDIGTELLKAGSEMTIASADPKALINNTAVSNVVWKIETSVVN